MAFSGQDRPAFGAATDTVAKALPGREVFLRPSASRHSHRRRKLSSPEQASIATPIVKPRKGKVSRKVAITGTELSNGTAVDFNGTAAIITKDTATNILTSVPAGATTGRISVTTSVGGTVTSVAVFKIT
jgi:hypothetical protein